MSMTRVTVLVLSLAVVVPAVAWQGVAPPSAGTAASPQAPQIQNGRVEVRAGTAIDREIAALSRPGAGEPVWIAWQVPMVDGDRDMCGWYSDRTSTVRGIFVDDGTLTDAGGLGARPARPAITAPTGPIPLEAGTRLVVLARLVNGRVERLRLVGDDCPMDAGGRTVYWLAAVASADSLRFLNALAQAGAPDSAPADAGGIVAESAVRAIGYHRDAGADAILDQLALFREARIRRRAASALASLRGAHGVATVARMIAATKDEDERRSLTSTIGQSGDAAAVAALRTLARDPDARVRAQASYWFVVRGGITVVPEALQTIARDVDDTVRRRTVAAIGRLPADAGVPTLIEIARTSTNPVVRREAVSALSRSSDGRAVAFMEELLKR